MRKAWTSGQVQPKTRTIPKQLRKRCHTIRAVAARDGLVATADGNGKIVLTRAQDGTVACVTKMSDKPRGTPRTILMTQSSTLEVIFYREETFVPTKIVSYKLVKKAGEKTIRMEEQEISEELHLETTQNTNDPTDRQALLIREDVYGRHVAIFAGGRRGTAIFRHEHRQWKLLARLPFKISVSTATSFHPDLIAVGECGLVAMATPASTVPTTAYYPILFPAASHILVTDDSRVRSRFSLGGLLCALEWMGPTGSTFCAVVAEQHNPAVTGITSSCSVIVIDATANNGGGQILQQVSCPGYISPVVALTLTMSSGFTVARSEHFLAFANQVALLVVCVAPEGSDAPATMHWFTMPQVRN